MDNISKINNSMTSKVRYQTQNYSDAKTAFVDIQKTNQLTILKN